MEKSSWYTARMAADGTAEICIYDEIGIWGITAATFITAVKALGAKALNVRLNSPGGSIPDGIAIYNFLTSEVAKGVAVTVDVDGWAASIASVIMLAGQTVRMGEGTFVMVHNPACVSGGDAEELRKEAALLDQLRAAILDIYVKETGQTRDQLSQWMDAETWFSAQEAVDHGFADCLTGRARAVACAQPRHIAFRHVPQLAAPNNKITKPANMKEIAKLLGIPEDSTEEQIIAKIQQERGESKAALDKATQALNKAITDADAARADAADTVVSAAVASGKIKAEAKDAFVKSYKADAASCKAMLDGIAPQASAPAAPVAPATPKGSHSPLSTAKGGSPDLTALEQAIKDATDGRTRVALTRQYRAALAKASSAK